MGPPPRPWQRCPSGQGAAVHRARISAVRTRCRFGCDVGVAGISNGEGEEEEKGGWEC